MPIGWDEFEDVQREMVGQAAAERAYLPTTAVAYDHQGPCAAVMAPLLTRPDPDEVVPTIVGLFAALQPRRCAIAWQLLLDPPSGPPDRHLDEELSDDGFLHGVRIVRGELGDLAAPRWTSTVLGYRREDGRVAAWAEEPVVQPLDQVPCPAARALRPILDGGGQLAANGLLLDVPGAPFEVFFRPGYLDASRRLEQHEYVRVGGRAFPRSMLS